MKKIGIALAALFYLFLLLPHPAFSQNSGWFKPYVYYDAGYRPYVLAVGDVNNDGLDDVVVRSSGEIATTDESIYVFLQNSEGGLDDYVRYDLTAVQVYSLDIGDVNGDGRNDVVVDDEEGFIVFYQNTEGKLTVPPVKYDATESFSYSTSESVRVGDLNGDGLMDVVYMYTDGFEIFLQDGSGNLYSNGYYTLVNVWPDALQIGDMNNDDLTDIVISHYNGGTDSVVVYYQDPGDPGTFTEPATYLTTTSDRNAGCAIADLDNDALDGNDLVVVADYSSAVDTINVFIQNAANVLTPAAEYGMGSAWAGGAVDILDINRDGRNDVMVSGDIYMTAVYQESGGTFIQPERYTLPTCTTTYPHGMDTGDINNDGMKDVVFANRCFGLVILYGWNTTDTIMVSSPVGGRSYEMGETAFIRWGSVGDITEVDIAYSIDGGVRWTTIISKTQNDGLYTWDVPYTPSENCLVRVSNSAGGAVGVTVKPFTIFDDGVDRIIITTPNGGESLVAEEDYEIQWQTTGDVGDVKIEYSTDNGTSWTEIIAATGNDGVFLWTVPNEVSDQCLIRISEAADNDPTDTSDNTFSIYAPGTEVITVTSPNGGESLTGGSNYTITWTSVGAINNVSLAYSSNNGTSWSTINASTPNDGSYSWTVPNVNSTQCLVRVSAAVGGVPSDQSNNTFSIGSIGDASITVLSPDGGNYYCIGRTQAITWTSTGSIGNVRLQYSTNKGGSWKSIVSSTANTGSYLWTVPNDPSTQCLVRISDAADGNPVDTSNAVFTIGDCGATLSITSPQGGEAWKVGSVHDITWVSGENVSGNVKLQYSTNSQATWKTIISSTTNDGSYSWTIPNAPSTACNVKISDAANASINNISFGVFSIVTGNEKPEISLNRTHLYYGSLKSSTAKTPTQIITVNNSGSGTLKWQATVYDQDTKDNDDLSWLRINNIGGTDSGRVEVYIEPLGLAVGTYNGAVKIFDINASNSPQLVKVTLTVYAAQSDANPFGTFETPVDGSTVMSSIPVTGWALDDIGIDKVTVWRSAVSGEGSGEIYIGEAVMVEGPRPDVEQTYPTYPMSYKAGWGYMLLTNMLPNGGNGTFKLHAYAKDLAGREVKLGSKTITCDNAHAVKPFGAIDTPTQGGEATGSKFRNQGWVLTPKPSKIPVDGSTIKVYVDGQKIGTVHYNIYRMDIATLFPGFLNSNAALGYLDFDTTVYESGVHTIQWVATDNAGHTDGIGSRYFSIQNFGYNNQAQSQNSRQSSTTGKNMPDKVRHPGADFKNIPLRRTPVKVKTGYSNKSLSGNLTVDKTGVIHITIPQDERLVVELNQPSGYTHSGYLAVNNQLRQLPPGASMDTVKGIFYWQPGPASLGKSHVVFISKDSTDFATRKEAIIEITPKFAGKPVVKDK